MRGVGAHNQNGVGERAIRTIVELSRAMILHDRRLWLEAMPQLLGPFDLSCNVFLCNHLSVDENVVRSIAKLCGTNEKLCVSNIHALG